MALDIGALWGSGGLWGALRGRGRARPWRELCETGEPWLRESTAEGMRLGERLEVLVARRRGLCWVWPEPTEEVGVDVVVLALVLVVLLAMGLGEALIGVLVCSGVPPPPPPPPVAPPMAARERKV